MRDPKTGTIYVDNTTLGKVASCDTAAALRSALGLTVEEDAHQLEVGKAVHEVMADYMTGKYNAEKCLFKYKLLYKPYSDMHDLDREGTFSAPNEHYRLGWKNSSAILSEWFDRNPHQSFPFSVNPKLVEVGFMVPLIDECVCGHVEAKHGERGCQFRAGCGCTVYRPAFIFYGRMDAIVQAAHDLSLYVLDHKTTKRLTTYTIDKYRKDSQMSGYVWAAQKTLGQPVAGIFINAIEMAKLPSDPGRKCRDPQHGKVTYAECGPMHMKTELLIFTRSPDQLDQWHRDAVKFARDYRAILDATNSPEDVLKQPMRGTFHGACGFCDFNKFCEAGRPVDRIDTMLVHRPWSPLSQEELSDGTVVSVNSPS